VSRLYGETEAPGRDVAGGSERRYDGGCWVARERRRAGAGVELRAGGGKVLFGDIIDQERPKEILRRILSSGRIPHAFLFTGPWGVGKTATALAAARALCCERGPAEACGECASCVKARRFTHPDIQFFFPMPSFRKEEEAARARREMLDEMAADPFFVVQFERAHSIGIDTIREIKSQTYMRPVESPYRAIVLSRAEKMTEEAANSLLKVLEEPSENVVFFVTTARPDRLLPTIVSRCREVAFAPLPSEAVARVLVERKGLDPERAALAAALSRGSLAAAMAHGEADLVAWRDKVLDLFDSGRPGEDARMHALAQEFLADGGRQAVLTAVEIMRVWCRDLLLARFGAPEGLVANKDRADRLEEEARGLTAGEISRRAAVLEDTAALVEANVNPTLALITALARYNDPALGPESISTGFPSSLFES